MELIMITILYSETVPSQLTAMLYGGLTAAGIGLIVAFLFIALSGITRAIDNNELPDFPIEYMKLFIPAVFITGIVALIVPFYGAYDHVEKDAGISFASGTVTVTSVEPADQGYMITTETSDDSFLYLGSSVHAGDTISVMGTVIDPDLSSNDDEALVAPVLIPADKGSLAGSTDDAGQAWYEIVIETLGQGKDQFEVSVTQSNG